MCKNEFKKSVMFRTSCLKASVDYSGNDGYAASVDKKGNVVVRPLNEGRNRISYSKMRSAVLKNR